MLAMLKNLCLTVVLAVVSTGALAEWTRVDESSEAISYVNLETLQRAGHIVKMQTLTDLKAERRRNNGPSFLSTEKLSEFDCKNKMSHLLSMAVFSGQMATGEKIHADNEPDVRWKPVGRDNYSDPFWAYACDKQSTQ
jgi:hypothetical protein